MPYIAPKDRHVLDQAVNRLPEKMKVGEVNYTVSRLCDMYLSDHGLSYTNVNNLIGALECIKLELYRRIAEPYEDEKMAENGDTYTVQHTRKPNEPIQRQEGGAPG